jgi:hypothetical protein
LDFRGKAVLVVGDDFTCDQCFILKNPSAPLIKMVKASSPLAIERAEAQIAVAVEPLSYQWRAVFVNVMNLSGSVSFGDLLTSCVLQEGAEVPLAFVDYHPCAMHVFARVCGKRLDANRSISREAY